MHSPISCITATATDVSPHKNTATMGRIVNAIANTKIQSYKIIACTVCVVTGLYTCTYKVWPLYGRFPTGNASILRRGGASSEHSVHVPRNLHFLHSLCVCARGVVGEGGGRRWKCGSEESDQVTHSLEHSGPGRERRGREIWRWNWHPLLSIELSSPAVLLSSEPFQSGMAGPVSV